jgi:MFS family permease
VLGGWITYNYSWRWIFFINLPVGILALFLVLRLIEDPPYLKAARHAGVRIDYIGIALLVLGVGALQIMLDRGQQDDWFASPFILTLAVLAVVGLISLVVWEWFAPQPVIDVHLFRSFNFFGTNAMMFLVGVAIFSSLVMVPQFLQTVLGYTAELAGLVLSLGAILLLIEMPIVGELTSKLRPATSSRSAGSPWRSRCCIRRPTSVCSSTSGPRRASASRKWLGSDFCLFPSRLPRMSASPRSRATWCPASSTSCVTWAAASAPRW